MGEKSFMGTGGARKLLTELAQLADVKINGDRPCDIKVHDDRLFERVLAQGSLGLGEAYMDGWWDCEALDELFTKILRAKLDRKLKKNIGLILRLLTAKYFNLQSQRRAFIVGEQHYDLDNFLYEKMLDPLMVYSCAYWKEADRKSVV